MLPRCSLLHGEMDHKARAEIAISGEDLSPFTADFGVLVRSVMGILEKAVSSSPR
jgi:hypothetical protein